MLEICREMKCMNKYMKKCIRLVINNNVFFYLGNICNGWNRCGLHNNEEVEIVVGEWLRMQEPDFYRYGVFGPGGGGVVFKNCDSSLEQTKCIVTL
jgi:hypothetical protein